MSDETLASDLLRGADDVAEFVYGDKRHRPKIYHARRHNLLPLFTIGNVIHGRKSTLKAYIADQERKALEAISVSDA